MKLSTLLLGAAIALGGALSGSAIADGGHDRGHGWDGYSRPGHYQERYRHGRPQHHFGYRGHHRHYVYGPPPHRHWAPPHHGDGWYGIQLFLGGDL